MHSNTKIEHPNNSLDVDSCGEEPDTSSKREICYKNLAQPKSIRNLIDGFPVPSQELHQQQQ